MSLEPLPPREVRLRKPSHDTRPVIAIGTTEIVHEDNRRWPLSDVASVLALEPSSIVAVANHARLVKDLDTAFSDDPRWQYKVTPVSKDVFRPNGTVLRGKVQEVVVNFFGWQRPNHKSTSRYHYPLDPVLFCRKGVNELRDGDGLVDSDALLAWAMDVRTWCQEFGLKVTPTSGGIAGQLLRDPRFWPEERRKVPKATNARARFTLPGNYYRLHVPEQEGHQAYYLDMESAHHSMAEAIRFPDPDSLYARGYWHATDDPEATGRVWCSIGSPTYKRVMESHGLLLAHVTSPGITAELHPLPYLEQGGGRMAYIYTNELPLIRDQGGIVDWVTAAWVSWNAAPALNRYATWAKAQVKEADAYRRRWLKPTLLSTYGLLAARPHRMEWGYRQAMGGEPRQYPAGSGVLDVLAKVGEIETETPTANVIYRGLIEAEQRVRALRLARELAQRGSRVLAVYADSVFVDSRDPLPFLPEPWRVQEELDRLRFFNPTSFTSAQLTKLPGIAREDRARLSALRQLRDGQKVAGPRLRGSAREVLAHLDFHMNRPPYSS